MQAPPRWSGGVRDQVDVVGVLALVEGNLSFFVDDGGAACAVDVVEDAHFVREFVGLLVAVVDDGDGDDSATQFSVVGELAVVCVGDEVALDGHLLLSAAILVGADEVERGLGDVLDVAARLVRELCVVCVDDVGLRLVGASAARQQCDRSGGEQGGDGGHGTHECFLLGMCRLP